MIRKVHYAIINNSKRSDYGAITRDSIVAGVISNTRGNALEQAGVFGDNWMTVPVSGLSAKQKRWVKGLDGDR